MSREPSTEDNCCSPDEPPTRSTTNTYTLLETFVLDADHTALEEHLVKNPVHQSDLDGCLVRALQIVQQEERTLSNVAQALKLLLQFGAKWNSNALLDDQMTPYHIICKSTDDHHELLDLMLKSSQRTLIDSLDSYYCTAMIYAVCNANINCLKCLITNGADVNVGDGRASRLGAIKWTPIMKAIWMMQRDSEYSSVIMLDILDLLLDTAVDQNKTHFQSCTIFILFAVLVRNVDCIKKLINKGASLDNIANTNQYVWTRVAAFGNIEVLECMLNRIDKDTRDPDGLSILAHVVRSGNVKAVRYLLDLGVDIPTCPPEVGETQCEQCKEGRLVVDDICKHQEQDPCIRAIYFNKLEIVKLLEEHGSQSCKSFYALRLAVKYSRVDIVSYLLTKYRYPLNIEYSIKDSDKRIFTLLTEPFSDRTATITELLLDHGADPAKAICEPTSANAVMAAIAYKHVEILALYLRSGVELNFRSWDSQYDNVSPFEASVLHTCYYVSVMLLMFGCSRGVYNLDNSHYKLKDNLKPDLKKLMKEWNVYGKGESLKQRCRSVILNRLSPRAGEKIGNLPLPQCLIKFLSIPELDDIVDAYKKATRD